jgi:hypothetical protein
MRNDVTDVYEVDWEIPEEEDPLSTHFWGKLFPSPHFCRQ